MERPPDALLHAVVESVPDAVVVVDADGRIVLANGRCRGLFGGPPSELLAQHVERLLPQWSTMWPLPGVAQEAHDQAQEPTLIRTVALRTDGSQLPAEVSLAPIPLEGRDHVCVTVRDIASRVRDEATFRSLLDGAPDATVVIDETATIIRASERVTTVLGYDRAELVGQSLAVLASSPGPQEVLERLGNYLREPEAVPMGYSREFWVRHHDGHDVPVELSLSPLVTDDRLLVSIALRDVTEQRRIEAQSQRQRDELIATVSHELRTPLASIIGYAELMSDLDGDDLSERARKLLEVIERNAGRELRLVDDLLTMAYLDDDRLQMQFERVDLTEVGRRVVDDAALRARERAVELTLAEAAALSPVRGDFYRLVQVLENLVVNAIKFTAPGGRVTVTVGDRDGRGCLEVVDTGIGVAPEEQERLFERLYRAPSAIQSQAQGAGLGLPIVRAIVDAHGGTIELESQVDVGTSVRVAIPYAAEVSRPASSP